MKSKIIPIILLLTAAILPAADPDWLIHRPRSEQYFYGRGQGPTPEQAEEAAKKEILLQLNSQVNAVARMHTTTTSGIRTVNEDLKTYINTARLRTAEVEARYKKGRIHHALIRYPESCALLFVESAASLYQNKLDITPESLIDTLDEGAMIRGARIRMIIDDALTTDYGDELSILYSDDTIHIQVTSFEGYESDLTETQRSSLQQLSTALFTELQTMNYQPASITGHANPTGETGEVADLITLSRARATTMATFLAEAGVQVGEITGAGVASLLGDPKTEGYLNRRVEIAVRIVP